MMHALPKYVWLVAAVVVLIALFNLPYGYYTLARVVIFGFSVTIAYFSIASGSPNYVWTSLFVLIAILFNPIIPIHLNREIWFWIDIFVAAIILAHLVFVRQKLTSAASPLTNRR
jgi:hypothetical protein